jgi:quinol monooxygenase YgiN
MEAKKMKDLTVGEFCVKFDACQEGRVWAYNLTPNGQNEMMSVIWDYLNFDNYLGWVIKKVLDDKTLRLFACRCVRETPIGDGRTAWDLLKDDRSKNAVIVAENFANGEATQDKLNSARAAAWSAAWAAAGVAAWSAESAAESAAAMAAASAKQKTWLNNPFLEDVQ